MIVKKVFNPIAVFRYMWQELVWSAAVSVLVYIFYIVEFVGKIGLPFSVAGILGSALAIFIAFRNNTAYSRWWEARTAWGNIVNNSRIFTRQIIANADNALPIGKVSEDEILQYKFEMVSRQIAYAHALRMHLRNENNWERIKDLISESEFETFLSKHNKPNFLLLKQGQRIKDGIRKEILGGFDNISLEPTLAGFSNFQGICERIKNTPLLRQYHFFTKLFLFAFILLLPFSLISDFAKMNIAIWVIPVSVLLSFVFGVMGKVGEVNEDPFENRITDIPMEAICNTIERDLLEMMGQQVIPESFVSQNGYLN